MYPSVLWGRETKINFQLSLESVNQEQIFSLGQPTNPLLPRGERAVDWLTDGQEGEEEETDGQQL